MRPASIVLFFMIIITTGVLSCNGGPVTPPQETNAAVTEIPTLWVAETPLATAPATVPAVSATATASATPPVSTKTTDTSPTPSATKPASVDFKVVGYVTHWHLNRLSSINLKGVTHLIWQGLEITDSGNPALRVANNAGWWQITEVVNAGHEAGAKVLASLIGLWSESSVNTLWRDDSLRKQLVKNLADTVKTYNLDGIDIDNENRGWDVLRYSTFIKELYDVLSPLGKIISVAGSPYSLCITPDVYHCVDFVNLMTYDMAAPEHSAFDDSLRVIDMWVSAGVPPEKLLIGIPFYGRDANDSFYEYWWIVEKYHPTAFQNEVNEPDVPGGIIWWNGPDLAKQKVNYMKRNGFGGVMMYELGQDSLDSSSLLQSVFDSLKQPVESTANGISGLIHDSRSITRF